MLEAVVHQGLGSAEKGWQHGANIGPGRAEDVTAGQEDGIHDGQGHRVAGISALILVHKVRLVDDGPTAVHVGKVGFDEFRGQVLVGALQSLGGNVLQVVGRLLTAELPVGKVEDGIVRRVDGALPNEVVEIGDVGADEAHSGAPTNL